MKRATAKVAMYDRIVIRTADGSERQLEKVAVSPSVSGMLEPGTLGRFYGYKAIDPRGGFAIMLVFGSKIGLLSLVLGVLGVIGSIRYRRDRVEARTRYDADAGYA